jgi:hypothetical protein
MRRRVFKLSNWTLLALSLACVCAAQQVRPDEQQAFPILRGSSHDGLPRKLLARGVISRVQYAQPRSCGELIFPATVEIKLDEKPDGYEHPFLYLVVPCLYQPEGARAFINRHVEVAATKPDETAQPCFFDIKQSAIDSGGLPFYCARREDFLRALMRGPSSTSTEPVEFAGTLEKGVRYRAEVVRGDETEEWRLSIRLKLPFHHAGRVEWLNLKEFPELAGGPSVAPRKRIIFEVVERTIIKVAGQRRWNSVYDCRIIRVES